MSMERIDQAIAETGLPEPAVAEIRKAFKSAIDLITENNKRILQVNASEAQDPNDPDYLDTLWKAHAEDDEEIAAIEPEYQALIEQIEKHLKKMRELAKKHVPETLSEEQRKATRDLVNKGKPAIDTAIATATAMSTVLDSVLTANGKAIEGGVASLIPQPDSLKNMRGRKAGSSIDKPYMTRVWDALVNGESTQREGKGKFNFAADRISELWGGKSNSAARITGEELEEAFYQSLGKPLRSLSTSDVPVHEFEFTKEIDNGDGKTEQKKATVKVIGQSHAPEVSEAKTETPKVETPAETKPETKPETENKNQAPVNSGSTPAPAKKTAAAPTKQETKKA